MTTENNQSFKQKSENHTFLYVLKIIVGTAITIGGIVWGFAWWYASDKIERERFEANKQITELKNQVDKLKQESEQLKSQPNLTSNSKIDTPQELQSPQDNPTNFATNNSASNKDSSNSQIAKTEIPPSKYFRIGSSKNIFMSVGVIEEYYFDGIANKPVAFVIVRTPDSSVHVRVEIEDSISQSMQKFTAFREINAGGVFTFTPPKDGRYKQ
jgi:hypothetical protein